MRATRPARVTPYRDTALRRRIPALSPLRMPPDPSFRRDRPGPADPPGRAARPGRTAAAAERLRPDGPRRRSPAMRRRRGPWTTATGDDGRRALVRAMQSLAHGIGATWVAEGVGTAEELSLMARADTPIRVQGYMVANPGPPRARVVRAEMSIASASETAKRSPEASATAQHSSESSTLMRSHDFCAPGRSPLADRPPRSGRDGGSRREGIAAEEPPVCSRTAAILLGTDLC